MSTTRYPQMIELRKARADDAQHIGAVFDAVLGRKIAEATTKYLVDEIARAIEEPSVDTRAQLG